MLPDTLTLARRVEAAEARNHRIFVETAQRVMPDIGAESLEIAGGVAAFAGPGHPLSQAFGLGLAGAPTEVEVDRLIEFFESRGTPVAVEVCNLAEIALANSLIDRGCRVDEHSHVLVRETEPFELVACPRVKLVEREVLDEWSDILTRGFTEGESNPGLQDLVRLFWHQENAVCYGASVDGRIVGGGCAFLFDDLALLAGASTLREYRGRGIQLELLNKRLELCAERAISFVAIGTAPGSTSQRNCQRTGFEIAYARTKYTGPHEQ